MSRLSALLFFLILLFAWALRTNHLAQRPMHTDEAVHAVKFGNLLEHHDYRYDPYEYHGPTLNYFSLIPTWIRGEKNLVQVSEITLRGVPAFFGVVLILCYLLIRRELSWSALLVAGLFTAISPAMVFYSRYYIQEMLLVCFSCAMLLGWWRFLTSGLWAWAIFTGVSMGLLHATKETSVITFAAMLCASLIAISLDKNRTFAVWQRQWLKKVAGLVVSAMIVSALFYSSFGMNPDGVLDSYKTLLTYVDRAGGQHQAHLQPWYYYFQLLLFNHTAGHPVWSEATLVLLCLYSYWLIFFRRRQIPVVIPFIGWYALIMTISYCSFSYKTPWSMLGFYQPFILLAGFAAVYLIHSFVKRGWRISFMILLWGIAGHLLWQSLLQIGKYDCDPSNPYVYGHTSRDIFPMVARIRALAEVHPDGKNAYVEIVCSGDDYWPLPWYLRDFSRVGYWNHVDANALVAALIVASPDQENAVLQKVYEKPPPGERNLYVPMFDTYMELRPGVELRGYVTKELWDRLQQKSL